MQKKFWKQKGEKGADHYSIFLKNTGDILLYEILRKWNEYYVIQAVMGHANIETTMDIYAEVTDMKKQKQ